MNEVLAELAEEFCRELQEGLAPTVEGYAARHPELAAEIREVFPALQALERAGGRYAEIAGGLAQHVDPELGPDEALDSDDRSPADFVQAVLTQLKERAGSYGRYRVRGEVGRGGQGAVLAVYDEDLRRNLAMKLALAPHPKRKGPEETDSRSLGRFLEEAQVTAQLDHPGIVPVHELGLDSRGDVYFTMKLVRGRDLRAVFEMVRAGAEDWTPTRALSVLLKVCDAMAYAHSKGVIHRDLKPSNVMVGKFGEVYVMDWGLARVLGKEDARDLRIQTGGTGKIRSSRHPMPEDPSSPLVTMDGDVVGTPAYMSPEQARGELEAMGPHSDVYAVGAMLYQLLTGEMPYVPSDVLRSNRAVWALVQEGPPDPVHARAREVAVELAAICEKAMARDVKRRYADMSELGEDLRAFLENRVVAAYEAGAVAELRKWIRRNRALAGSVAAGLVAVLAGLIASWVLKGQSDAHAKEASETASREKQRADQVLRLSAFQDLEDLRREADELWPPWPHHGERYQIWLDKAAALVSGLDTSALSGDPGHRERLAELEARALPYSEEQREADRRGHPRHVELLALRAKLEAYERAEAVSRGSTQVVAVSLDVDDLPASAIDVADLAWPLVEPNRTEYGREAEGLALARVARERVENEEDDARTARVLVWALAANGLDEEAVAQLSEAMSLSDGLRLGLAEDRVRLEETDRGAQLSDLRRKLAEVESDVSSFRTWSFADERDRWWHAQLVKLLAEIEAFSDPETGLIEGMSSEYGWGIRRRLAWAESLEERSVSGEQARVAWSEAIASISDRVMCPAYEGLVIEPQLGLLPIGRDPESGLWEFAHPLTGATPERDDDERLLLTDETGLVFVLLPGGTFLMGAQNSDPNGPNYYRGAHDSEVPVHAVRVTPLFLSKFEMSQGQWIQMTGTNPSLYAAPSASNPSRTLQLPVEQLDWDRCMTWMRRVGLAVPSEAQWEYGARGGTSTSWSTGDARESLHGHVNLMDASARAGRVGNPGVGLDWPEFNDGFVRTAPVDALKPNPFGLHHVHGNVYEWCMDGWDPGFYRKSPSVDPVAPWAGAQTFVIRGGGLVSPVGFTRSNARYQNTNEGDYDMGLRPARAITGEIRYVGEGK